MKADWESEITEPITKQSLLASTCLPVFSANYGLVLIITSEIELEIAVACCAKVLIEKKV